MRASNSLYIWALGAALTCSAPAIAADASGAVSLPDAYTRGNPAAPSTDPWWSTLQDDSLSSAIGEGLRANHDLEGARARIRAADALLQTAMAPLLPSLSLDAAANAAPIETLGFQFGGLPTDPSAPDLFYSASVKFEAALGLDITGRHVLGLQAGTQDKRATQEETASAAILLANRIGGAWLDVALHQERIALLQDQIRANREILEIAQLGFESGASTGLDVLQQKQQLAARESLLPLGRASLALAEQQLAVLMGHSPDTPIAIRPSGLPELPPDPGLGAPDDLLELRPGLRALDRRLNAARQRRQASRRAFAPSVTALADAGWQYFDAGEFREQFAWSVGGAVSLPIFDNGLTVAETRQARANELAAAATLRQGTLDAVREVESALALESERRNYLGAVSAQTQAAEAAYRETRRRYADGIAEYLQLLTALTAWQNAALSELQAERDLLGSRIDLHTALGGEWAHEWTHPQRRTRGGP